MAWKVGNVLDEGLLYSTPSPCCDHFVHRIFYYLPTSWEFLPWVAKYRWSTLGSLQFLSVVTQIRQLWVPVLQPSYLRNGFFFFSGYRLSFTVHRLAESKLWYHCGILNLRCSFKSMYRPWAEAVRFCWSLQVIVRWAREGSRTVLWPYGGRVVCTVRGRMWCTTSQDNDVRTMAKGS